MFSLINNRERKQFPRRWQELPLGKKHPYELNYRGMQPQSKPWPGNGVRWWEKCLDLSLLLSTGLLALSSICWTNPKPETKQTDREWRGREKLSIQFNLLGKEGWKWIWKGWGKSRINPLGNIIKPFETERNRPNEAITQLGGRIAGSEMLVFWFTALNCFHHS